MPRLANAEDSKRDVEYGTFRPQKPAIRSQEDTELGRNWMVRIDDDTLLSALTIPGTHDSAAYTYPVPFVQTQTLDINHQLDHGIRYFDLRCGLRNDVLAMVHGPTLLHLTLRSVLDTMTAFLTTNPSEALIIQLKKDRPTENSSIRFSHAIRSLLSHYPIHTDPTTPSLSQLRGSILLFRRFPNPNPNPRSTPYGIDVTSWPDNPTTPFTITTPCTSPPSSIIQLTVQDHYFFTDTPLPSLLHTKTNNVTDLCDLSRSNPDSRHWYLNFCSASEVSVWYRYSPRQVAVGGYWGWKWEGGVNKRLREWVAERYGRRRLGIVVLDFVGEEGAEDLVRLLIRSNELKARRGGGEWRIIVGLMVMLAVFLAMFEVVMVYMEVGRG